MNTQNLQSKTIKFTKKQLKEIVDKLISKYKDFDYEILKHQCGEWELYFFTKEDGIEGDNFSLFPNYVEDEEWREYHGMNGYSTIKDFEKDLKESLKNFNGEW